MATYPNNIFSPREKQNRSRVEYDPEKKTVIFVEDIKKLDEEVVAIENELGANFRDSNGNIDLKNKKIVNLADPTGDQDAATKNYIDTLGKNGLKNSGFTSPTYVSANSFTVAGDVTSWLRPGRGLVITFQTSGVKRCVATSLSYNSGTDKTTITVVGDSLVNETITSVLLSLSDLEAINKNIAYIMLQKTSSQTITSGQEPEVTWNSKVLSYNDSIFSWSSGNSIVNINAPGIYIASVSLRGSWNNGTWMSFLGMKEGQSSLGQIAHRIQGTYTGASYTFIFLNPTYIKVYVYQSSGADKTVDGAAISSSYAASWFSIAKIG